VVKNQSKKKRKRVWWKKEGGKGNGISRGENLFKNLTYAKKVNNLLKNREKFLNKFHNSTFFSNSILKLIYINNALLIIPKLLKVTEVHVNYILDQSRYYKYFNANDMWNFGIERYDKWLTSSYIQLFFFFYFFLKERSIFH